LLRFLDSQYDFGPDIVNYVLKPTVGKKLPYEIVAPYTQFIDNDCIKMPYDIIRLNNSELFINVFEKLFDNLDSDRKYFISGTLDKYYSSQNNQVLTDPIQFFMDTREKALILADTFKGKHT